MARAHEGNGKSSADLEREVNEQRGRVEARIGEIRDRLSPGQLLDEALSYTRHGGAHFASNLGQQLAANPMPAALAGIGIAWLIASSAGGGQTASPAAWREPEEEYPYARIPSGGLRRTRHAADEAGEWWIEFQTESGETYRARTNERGQRAGNFIDQAGKRFSGFIDDAGNRIRQFQDESGNLLDEGLGWASHSWRDARHGIGRAVQNATSGARMFGGRVADSARNVSQDLGGNMQSQADQLSRQFSALFNEQPLVAGALAFAAGAAIGATLPHTPQEDELVGEEADRLRRKATKTAADLYEQGKEQVSHAYEEARRTGSTVYEDAKDTLAGESPVRH